MILLPAGRLAEPCRPSGESVANPRDNPLAGWPSIAGLPKALGPPKVQAEGKAKRQKVINVFDSAEAAPPQSGATCNADTAFEGTGCASGDAPELASPVASASAQGSVVDLTAVSDSTAVVGKPPPKKGAQEALLTCPAANMSAVGLGKRGRKKHIENCKSKMRAEEPVKTSLVKGVNISEFIVRIWKKFAVQDYGGVVGANQAAEAFAMELRQFVDGD